MKEKLVVDVEKALWNVLVDDDARFLKKLSKWIINNFGNVNVAQKVNVIRIKYLKPK